MYGCNGKVLKVDLSAGTVEVENYDESFARKFLGGNGLAARLIHDLVPPDADPLGADNAIVFSVGPLTDTPVWGTSRGHLASISPLTGLFADSNFGGRFAVAQKRTGFDAIAIRGQASGPVYLQVTEGGGEIRDASDLWGRDTVETIEHLEEREGKGAACAAIGPAGEQGVLFAAILAGGRRLGVAGRGGLGSVMGAKRLKAVVVKGSRRTKIADRTALTGLLKRRYTALKGNTRGFALYGTPILVSTVNAVGLLGTRNNTREVCEYPEAIGHELLKEQYWEEDVSCHGCPVGCGKKIRVKKGPFQGTVVKMPEYETLYALGTMLDNRDLDAIIEANHLCNLLGLDTISMGVTLAFVAECMERGIISEKEMGARVGFAEPQTLSDLIRKTARMEGIGVHLGLGSVRIAERFGGDAHKYLHAVKGMEMPGHSARGLRGMSLAYAVSTRGGTHHDGRPNYLTLDPDPGFEAQPEHLVKINAHTAVGDSLVICRFTGERGLGIPLNEDVAEVVRSVTGWDMTLAELEKVGERIYNLERLINVERGVTRRDDTLPHRVMNEPIPGGPQSGRYCSAEDLDAMLDRYYSLMGWSPDGIPTEEKLSELGLR